MTNVLFICTAHRLLTDKSKQFARLLDFYLSENKDHWAEIQKIAHQDTPEAFEKLRKYALEGLRLATPAFRVLRAVNIENGTVVDGERQIPVKRGDTIFADLVKANVDAKAFPDPLEIKLDRPDSSYIHQGYGEHMCLGRPIVMVSMAVQLGAFARLKNLRRAPGPAGQLKAKTVNGAFQVYMNEDWSEWTPFPANMKVQFDGF
jgi:cytochrome P450